MKQYQRKIEEYKSLIQKEDDGRKDDRGDPCVCPEGRNPVRAGTERLKNQKRYCG